MPDRSDFQRFPISWWFSIAMAILLLDQLTKNWIVNDFFLGQRDFITSFFNLVRVHNYGAAFSFLSDAGGWQRWFLAVLFISFVEHGEVFMLFFVLIMMLI